MAPRISYRDYLTTNQNFISVVGRLRDWRDNRARERGARGHRRRDRARSLRCRRRSRRRPLRRDGVVAQRRADRSDDAAADDAALGAAACLLAARVRQRRRPDCSAARSRADGRSPFASRPARSAGESCAAARRVGVLALAGGLLGVLVALPVARSVMLPTAGARGSNFYGALGEFTAPQHRRASHCCSAWWCACSRRSLFGLVPGVSRRAGGSQSAISATAPTARRHRDEQWTCAAVDRRRWRRRSRWFSRSAADCSAASWRRSRRQASASIDRICITFLVRPSEVGVSRHRKRRR